MSVSRRAPTGARDRRLPTDPWGRVLTSDVLCNACGESKAPSDMDWDGTHDASLEGDPGEFIQYVECTECSEGSVS